MLRVIGITANILASVVLGWTILFIYEFTVPRDETSEGLLAAPMFNFLVLILGLIGVYVFHRSAQTFRAQLSLLVACGGFLDVFLLLLGLPGLYLTITLMMILLMLNMWLLIGLLKPKASA